MLKSLQAGRALAALGVVMFHLHVCFNLLNIKNSLLADLSTHANIGVYFFFALSGFIMLHVHGKDINKPNQLPKYIRNRVVRIYPIYWVCSALFVALLMFAGGATEMPSTIGGWISSFMLVRFTDQVAPLNVAWTLFYEVAFYGLFGMLLLNRILGTMIFGIWFALIIGIHQFSAQTSIVGVWISMLCLNFFVGMAACWLHKRLNKQKAIGLLVASVIALVTCCAFVGKGLGIEVFNFLVGLSFGGLIAAVTALETKIKLNFGFLILLGDASFSLYMIHVHVLSELVKGFQSLHLFKIFPHDLLFVMAIIPTVGLAILFHHFVEKPVISFAKALLSGKTKIIFEHSISSLGEKNA